MTFLVKKKKKISIVKAIRIFFLKVAIKKKMTTKQIFLKKKKKLKKINNRFLQKTVKIINKNLIKLTQIKKILK